MPAVQLANTKQAHSSLFRNKPEKVPVQPIDNIDQGNVNMPETLPKSGNFGLETLNPKFIAKNTLIGLFFKSLDPSPLLLSHFLCLSLFFSRAFIAS